MIVPTRSIDGSECALLDHTRSELIETVRGLSEAESRRHLVPSRTTPIGLIKHAAFAK